MSLRADEDQVFCVGIISLLETVNHVVKPRDSALGNLEADRSGFAGFYAAHGFFNREVTVRVESLTDPGGFRAIDDLLFYRAVIVTLFRREVVIGLALCDELAGSRAVLINKR